MSRRRRRFSLTLYHLLIQSPYVRVTMGKYTVQVFTGDALWAGTSNRISIKFIGTNCNSKHHQLATMTGFWAGSEQTFSLNIKENIGELLLIELEAKPPSYMSFIDDEWFCSKIIVTTPEGGRMLFPCHRWMSCDKKLVLRNSVAMLKTQDLAPQLLAHRQENMKRRCQDFNWRIFAPGLPHQVNIESPSNLPPEVRFSFTKQKEFLFISGTAFMKMKLECPSNDTWNSIDDLNGILSNKTKTYEYVQEHWRRDDFFGYQFLNGLNPMIIRRCSELPKKFPVTSEMVQGFLPEGSTLKSEMKKGHIFLCDYKRLKDLEGNEINRKKQYLAAPLCLLFSDRGKLLPIAIQLNQEPGPGNPIFLPSDSEHDWLVAKTFVRNAEFNEHELNFHLLRTHLLGEVFTVAMMRTLPSCHPLFKLLVPHSRYTLQINIMGRNHLISPDGSFSKFTAIGNDSMTTFLKRAASSLTYSSLCPYLPKTFPFSSPLGFPESFRTVGQLAKFVTMVIFTVSAQHAAVNNGQFDFGGYMPNFPSSLRCPPPRQKGSTTKDSILETLPDVSTTVNAMAIVYLLSQDSDRYPLGHYPEELFSEETPQKLKTQFKNSLLDLETSIDARNKTLDLPYTFLNPRNVDNSIAI
ncbi:hypothetical protein NFI96_021230 [Prochilodus magdalenae]|nr:hypothetical protein NFI96_021230 [Prochilodus magdalenae]